MTTDKAGRVHSRGDAQAHVAAAHSGKGRTPLVRIALYSFRHPVQASIAIGATIIASVLQLLIPRILGHAVDQAQDVLNTTTAGAEQALFWSAMTLLALSVARGFHAVPKLLFGIGGPPRRL